ncbi:LOW QUALITY PROTEIN: leukocyte antigen CD37 [Labeo rohita]|uniref:LOW QUALITY PROTEIN: leukocyte antigen CD37 n=1 Tax=Labeo rohita TaxID=84645 RepID=UPI0021E1DFD0|nr:LOW QUALITY PROTEIN: leukocyte antigen CD37 [Labeo rohita]
MASECCLSLTKYFLFLFNLIFFLLGSLLLSMGLWILLSEDTIFMPSPPYISIHLFSYILIVSGSVTMSLGFLGCLGSLKTVKCLLGTYFILLTVLLAAQIVGGVLLYTQKTEWTGSLENHLMKSFGHNDSSLQNLKKTLDYIQEEAKCCGWEGKTDWKDSIPCSCYDKGNATANEIQKSNFSCPVCPSSNQTCVTHEQGCSEIIKAWLENNIFIIFVVILAISLTEICGMILSMCLYREGSVNYNTVLY